MLVLRLARSVKRGVYLPNLQQFSPNLSHKKQDHYYV